MKLMNSYYIYILTNKSNTLYIGVTNNLQKRLYEHKNKLVEGFTKKYNLDKLIYFETYQDINEAIKREKQIKGWIRKRKIELIKSKNPTFEDLSLSF
ncbi:endonuclease [Candidatus Roizmanbacteria bacterium CG_4_10_14_0_2_um_filter_36_35]|uniref:Endonuclease n=5 Tax=Candidatus Roizmaniibacteriota TaxID=1752723 RepID=A0A2M7E4V9_9BACT|nr:GIY-YIG nuclease family protein [Candidatus Roizmanbacteria bacterium]PIQ72445.1 MAG: endonuclease [Candidatus Roizmanbacteria bacterium CG11_big_fil_rev_8_21_14_0_20_35_14]PIV10684.1 MAG: endonuclease [Candidatus Roizmanbacteria bacterium CG03_land_8_20_14_0_80_35_26]PIV62751.1 MAG: endonuclease [Candidatus Roizmanbacteria bacterium CG01_land_8_20_14_3_00_33_9]PIZ68014.1 MAG: endonuclease [Candidatus Roizmanbacteria bacterium CG_4_10_14_0_2_um_filter_36_35]PJC33408.1 MAG: endonuclease [Can